MPPPPAFTGLKKIHILKIVGYILLFKSHKDIEETNKQIQNIFDWSKQKTRKFYVFFITNENQRRNWDFVTKSYFLIPILLQPNGVGSIP